jgi:hypothetical protein
LGTADPPKSLEAAYCEHFDRKAPPETFNGSHRLVIVASTLDAATERIVNYLAEEYEVAINAVFFRVFREGDRELLTRVWLREEETPDEGSTLGSSTVAKREWNGEYYVNFDEGDHRRWEDAQRHGFVSAGGGPTWGDAMKRLQPGNRIWVYAPGEGYCGVGEVLESAVPVNEFMVTGEDGRRVQLKEAGLICSDMYEFADNPDRTEYLVRVKRRHTVSLAEVVWERGFFANQNCVAQPRHPKWAYTVDRLKELWRVD